MKWNNGMGKLFERAKERELWFNCRYQNLWFSPEDLEEKQANGKFRWGAVNWELRDPQERIEQLRREMGRVQNELDNFTKRLNK